MPYHIIVYQCDIFVFEGVLLLSMYMHVVGNRMPGFFCFVFTELAL